MRIDMVSEHASPLAALGGADAGGQNVHVAELAAGLAGLGHEVVVHTRRDSPELPPAVKVRDGITVVHVPAGPPHQMSKDELLPHMPEFGDFLARRWTRNPPDLVHAHFWMSGLAALRGAREGAFPVLQTFHALGVVKRRHQGAKDTSPPQRQYLEPQVARAVDLVVATTRAEVDELTSFGVPAANTVVLPCGIDLRKFTPSGPVSPRGRGARVLSIGRLVERKGVDTAIAAMAAVPEAELLVAGGPEPREWQHDPEVARLRAVAEAHGVSDRVRFLGPVAHDRTPQLYRSVDVVVSAPWYEPFGTVPLEAMACGVPPVVTAVGGHLDTVVDGETGLVVPPKDPAALASRINELLANPQWRRQLGLAGVRRVRSRYGWDRLARATEAVYRQVLSRQPREATATLGGAP